MKIIYESPSAILSTNHLKLSYVVEIVIQFLINCVINDADLIFMSFDCVMCHAVMNTKAPPNTVKIYLNFVFVA